MSSFETRVKLRMSASALLTGTPQMVTAKLADVATAALSTFVVATADGCRGTTSGT